MAGSVFPQEQPRPTDSLAEYAVYDALKKQLPNGWTAWHSLRIRTSKGYEGEGDFILAIPDRGFLVLEVKGGQIEQRDGRWFQNGHPMDYSPREQALGYAKKLFSRLPLHNGMTVPYGVLTLFPDIQSSYPPSQDNLHDLTLTGLDLPYLKESLQAKVDKAFPEGYVAPKCDWKGALHSLWGETWVPRVRLGHKKEIHEEERYRLDQQQAQILEALEDNDRLLIEGVAGSGKTVLAREATLREAAKGKTVLFLCYTDALAHWLQQSLENTSITVQTVPRFALSLLQQQGMANGVPQGPAEWSEVSLSAAVEALPEIQNPPDVVVVDEAQDLGGNEWLLVEELTRNIKSWIFYDPAQGFWDDRQLPNWTSKLFKYKLTKCYRCPQEVLEFAKHLGGQPHNEKLVKQALKDQVVSIVECPSETNIPAKIENEIRKLLSEGFKPQDIAVLSLRGRSADSVVTKEKIGSVPIVNADSPEMDQHVVADTFLRFKGLERPAIIVTDLRLVEDRLRLRTHIAMTRALEVVRVVKCS